MKQLFLYLLGIFTFVFLVFAATLWLQGGPEIPQGAEGPEALKLAEKILMASDQDNWKKISFIDFTFTETDHRHLRDLKRNLARVDFKESGNDYRALINLTDGKCVSYRNSELLDGGRKESICEKATDYHKHEYYLLNPFENILNNSRLKKIGERALLVEYLNEKKEVTDTFLIVTDAYFLPTHWKMWAAMSPLKGMETSFEKWERVPEGPIVSLKRRNFLFEILFFVHSAGKGSLPVDSNGTDPFSVLTNP